MGERLREVTEVAASVDVELFGAVWSTITAGSNHVLRARLLREGRRAFALTATRTRTVYGPRCEHRPGDRLTSNGLGALPMGSIPLEVPLSHVNVG